MRRSLTFFASPALLVLVLAAGATTASAASAAEIRPPVAPGCTEALSFQESASRSTPPIQYGEDPDHVELVNRVIVSPPSFEAIEAVKPGDYFLCTITLRNRYDRRITLLLEPQGLRGARSGQASAEFIDPDDPDAASTAASWIEPVQPSVTLDPRGVARVTLRITVPKEPPVGAVYASLHITSKSTAPGPGDTDIGIESTVSIPFLLSVGGEGVPELHLRTVRAPKLRWSRDPWTLRANLDNDGTLHAVPRGRVRVRSLFGNTVNELPITGTALLPGGRQRVETTWDDVPWFGIYRYDVRVTPTDDEHADRIARANGWFVALPPWWVFVIAAALLLFAVLGSITRRHRERDWDEDEDEDEDSIDTHF